MKRGTRNRRPHSDGKNPPPTSVSERVSVFAEKVQSKYKILVTFTQILSKVTTIYPLELPPLFTSFWENFGFLSLELSFLPLNCVFDSNFHDRLVLATVAPVVVVGGIFLTWAVMRQ